MQVSGFILSDWMHIDLCLWRLIHNGASWNRFMQLWLTKKFYDSTYPRLSWKLQGYPLSPKNEPLNPYQFYFNRSAQSTCCERSQAKWQAGRHSFKSNSELQAFKRRYEVGCLQFRFVQHAALEPQEAKKVRETAPQRLEEALRRRRTAEPTAAAAVAAPLSAGWAAVRTLPKAVAVNTVRGVGKCKLEK